MSSYKGKFGAIQYYVKAVMERPSQSDVECQKSFEVEEPIDVNTLKLVVREHNQCSTQSSLSYFKVILKFGKVMGKGEEISKNDFDIILPFSVSSCWCKGEEFDLHVHS